MSKIDRDISYADTQEETNRPRELSEINLRIVQLTDRAMNITEKTMETADRVFGVLPETIGDADAEVPTPAGELEVINQNITYLGNTLELIAKHVKRLEQI